LQKFDSKGLGMNQYWTIENVLNGAMDPEWGEGGGGEARKRLHNSTTHHLSWKSTLHIHIHFLVIFVRERVQGNF
jgi:hypothetical protein